MSDYYDKEGKPISLEVLGALYGSTEDYRRIGLDYVGNWRVSTVWLGSDHNFSEVGPPLIFETMVFEGNKSDDKFCARYATEAEARTGHARVVRELMFGTSPEKL